MKYKVLYQNGKFYPMVKETRFLRILSNPLWWLTWKRIGDHRSISDIPFGLYEKIDHGYNTADEAEQIIKLYKSWII
jgi:hypothetical protein